MSRVDDVDYVKMIERARAKYLRLKERKSLNTTLHHDYSMTSKTIEDMHRLHLAKLDIERQRALQDVNTRCACPDCPHSNVAQCTMNGCKCCLTSPVQAETPSRPYRAGWGLGMVS